MRDIKTITENEIKEFLDIIVGGEYTLSEVKYIKIKKCVKVGVRTLWGGEIEESPYESIIDTFEFTQTDYDEGDFPAEQHRYWLYQEFLLIKGFKESVFK